MTLIGVKILHGYFLVKNIDACSDSVRFLHNQTKHFLCLLIWRSFFFSITTHWMLFPWVFYFINHKDLINHIETIYQIRHKWSHSGIEWQKLMSTHYSELFHWTEILKTKSLNLKFLTGQISYDFQQREHQINQSFQGGSSTRL